MHLLFFSTILPTRIHLSTTGVIAKPSMQEQQKAEKAMLSSSERMHEIMTKIRK
jgi:hypothetical protein